MFLYLISSEPYLKQCYYKWKNNNIPLSKYNWKCRLQKIVHFLQEMYHYTWQVPRMSFRHISFSGMHTTYLILICWRHWIHDDVIQWKHFPRYWPFVQGIHRSPVNSPHKGQWRGALMFPFTFALINGWVNNRVAGDLRLHHAHYDVTVMNKLYCRSATMDAPSVKLQHCENLVGELNALISLETKVTPTLQTTITMTSQWARWRLKSPALRLFNQAFIQAQIKENIKAPRHWPLCAEFTGDRWIPRTKGQ